MCLCILACTVFMIIMLIIVWPHVSHSSLGEETETGEGHSEGCQHLGVSRLSWHPCYGSHGQCMCGQWKTKLDAYKAQPHGLSPLLISLVLNTMWIDKKDSLDIVTLLTVIQTTGVIIGLKMFIGCKCQQLIKLFAQACFHFYVKVFLSFTESLRFLPYKS